MCIILFLSLPRLTDKQWWRVVWRYKKNLLLSPHPFQNLIGIKLMSWVGIYRKENIKQIYFELMGRVNI